MLVLLRLCDRPYFCNCGDDYVPDGFDGCLVLLMDESYGLCQLALSRSLSRRLTHTGLGYDVTSSASKKPTSFQNGPGEGPLPNHAP